VFIERIKRNNHNLLNRHNYDIRHILYLLGIEIFLKYQYAYKLSNLYVIENQDSN